MLSEKPTMREWYRYHQEQVNMLKDLSSPTLIEKNLLNYHQFWIDDLEKMITTADDEVKKDEI